MHRLTKNAETAAAAITPWEKEGTPKVVFAAHFRPVTLRDMETPLRIREATPAELFAERLEREAQAALVRSPELAADYRRQAEMLRQMAAATTAPARSVSTIH